MTIYGYARAQYHMWPRIRKVTYMYVYCTYNSDYRYVWYYTPTHVIPLYCMYINNMIASLCCMGLYQLCQGNNIHIGLRSEGMVPECVCVCVCVAWCLYMYIHVVVYHCHILAYWSYYTQYTVLECIQNSPVCLFVCLWVKTCNLWCEQFCTVCPLPITIK